MKRLNIIGGAVLGSAILIAPLAASAGTGFTGDYGPGSATIVTSSDGSIDTSLAPDSITLTGGSNNDGFGSDQLYQFTVASAVTISFDWSWSSTDCCGPFFDAFGYNLNGAGFVAIVDEFPGDPDSQIAQSGHFSLGLHAGDAFAFDQNSLDNFGDPGVTTVSNFDAQPGGAVPEPAAWALMLIGFGGLGVALRQRRAPRLA